MRRLLALGLQPLRWTNLHELQQLSAGQLVIGYSEQGEVLTLNAASCLAPSIEAPVAAPPDGSGQGWLLPRALLCPLLEGQEASQSLLRQACVRPSVPPQADPTVADGGVSALRPAFVGGWLLAVAFPLLTSWWLGHAPVLHASLAQWLHFLAALASGLCVWVLNLAPPFVGAMMAMLLMVLGSGMPPELAFSGLASASFYLLLGMLGVSVAVQQSGLVERLMGAVLRYFPGGARTVQISVVMIGVLMSVFIPSSSGRLQLLAPMVSAFARVGHRSALALAGLSGTTLFSTAFLLGNAGNFIVLGLLPAHWQPHVNWLMWFKGSAVYVAVLGLWLALSLWWCPLAEAEASAPASAGARPFSFNEGTVALALACLTLGLGLGNVHHIETAWLTLFVFLLLWATGVLRWSGLQGAIHWPILIYLVCTVGFARGFAFTGLNDWIGAHLGGLTALMRSGQSEFLCLLIGIVLLMRLLLPAVVCVTTICAVMMPLADAFGLNPWVIGFVVLTTCEVWFMPHQSTDYLLFRESTGLSEAERTQLLRRNLFLQGGRLLALSLSIPYWRFLGYVQ
ncbi:SLC13 family permease [Curvibacter cyanobacteriorum]|nr:SLC13 family permease [Curvibacter sp. HBC61]